jgi:sodium transport system ATP-binding protein
MIEVRALHKRFGARLAVDNLSFSAANGCITGLLGANGAGKTTCLRMIAGALKPDAGTVAVDGPLGALLDHTGLYARLTVRENLRYFGELQRIPAARLGQRIEEVLAQLNLKEISDQRASGLSLGQSAKVALGRALIHSPRNLLLDEPTNGLDVPAVRSLRDYLRALRDTGVCIVFSSHTLDEVRILCDSLVIVARGSVVAAGSLSDVCRLAETESLEEAFISLTGTREAAQA